MISLQFACLLTLERLFSWYSQPEVVAQIPQQDLFHFRLDLIHFRCLWLGQYKAGKAFPYLSPRAAPDQARMRRQRGKTGSGLAEGQQQEMLQGILCTFLSHANHLNFQTTFQHFS